MIQAEKVGMEAESCRDNSVHIDSNWEDEVIKHVK